MLSPKCSDDNTANHVDTRVALSGERGSLATFSYHATRAMPLQPGTRIGPYEILSLIGAGGMGEVYRAGDPRLDREVAIKILPELFARDPDRLARFEREAKTLAALNHPLIAHIYGVEDAGPVRGLVMEL